MSGGMALEQRREALELACAALDGLGDELWSAQGTELGPLLTLVDEVGSRVGAGRVAVLAEAVERGEASGGTTGAQRWLRDHAPSLRAGGSAPVVAVVEHTRLPRYALLKAAVLEARVPVVHAACVVDEYERIGHRLHPAAQGPVMETLVGIAAEGTRREIRAVRRRLVARYGHDGEFQGEQDRLHERTSLSQPMDDGSGLYEYRLVADAEGRAVLEAAVQALAAPRPADGEPDRRPSGQRRFDALVEVVRRGVASADGVPTTPKAELFVTMDLDDLTSRVGHGTVFGSGDVGELLGPETVRRLACDAGVVPVVLGSSGEVVDLGRRHRFFSSAQVRALWLRDSHCSFPGCSVPASWCDAHHLWHWADGGPTDLDHAALLCGRHHTVVHAKGFHGTVREGRVEWDLTPGAYDHWLERCRARSADALVAMPVSGPVAGRAAGSGAALGPHPRLFDEWGQVATAAPAGPPARPWRP